MFFEYSDEQRSFKDTARRFARERIGPVQDEDDRQGVFRKEVLIEMGKLGFIGGVIPEEYGGTNIGFFNSILIMEELAKVSASYASHLASQAVGPGLMLLRHGTEDQKQKYIPGLVAGEIVGCFASTEPDAGSDVASMRTKATKNEKGFVLNGNKTWITNAPVADVGLIFAYTDMTLKHRGISCFIVEMKKTPGITTTHIEKLGLHCILTGEINLDNAQLPPEALLGSLGGGFKMLMGLLGGTRLFMAARALGVGGACLEASIKYANERQQFGQSISKFQMIQEQIAEMFIEHEASKLLVYQAAMNVDNGRANPVESSVAKYFACESATRAADMALKIYGSYGFSMEYPIQRYIRDSRAFNITEGTSNIHKVIIARDLLGL